MNRTEELNQLKDTLRSKLRFGEMTFQEYTEELKKEQLKDFEVLKFYADPNCKDCYGIGHQGWSVDLELYIVCRCVSNTVLKLNAERQKISEN